MVTCAHTCCCIEDASTLPKGPFFFFFLIDKIEDLFRKILGYNDRLTNTIRIQLKKEVETYIVNSEDLHIIYV